MIEISTNGHEYPVEISLPANLVGGHRFHVQLAIPQCQRRYHAGVGLAGDITPVQLTHGYPRQGRPQRRGTYTRLQEGQIDWRGGWDPQEELGVVRRLECLAHRRAEGVVAVGREHQTTLG